MVPRIINKRIRDFSVFILGFYNKQSINLKCV